MSYIGRVLVVDDEEEWRDLVKETLERGKFEIHEASTVQEAKELIDANLYDLLVFDIRLEPNDPDNNAGMKLLEYLQELDFIDALEVIMLSAFGTEEQMRAAFRDYGVVDFIPKQRFDNREFLELVKGIYVERMQINLSLDIYWQNVSGPQEVTSKIKMPHGSVLNDNLLETKVATELIYLLRRLFYQAKSLVVKRLTSGYSGSGVLWVQPIREKGQGQSCIVKFGHHAKIENEVHNFENYIEPYIGGNNITNVMGLRRTPRLGGVIYSFVGAGNDELDGFGKFYRGNKIANIKGVLDNLFKDTCQNWYTSLGKLRHWDLVADYKELLGLNPVELEEIVHTKLTSVKDGDELCFRSLGEDRTFRNPIRVIPDECIYSTYVCISHGDLNENNIRIDHRGQTWLIDFQHTGEGHFLRDLTKLEAVVRFELLAPHEATLAERLALEEVLSNVEHFRELEELTNNFSTTNSAVKKALAISIYLRMLIKELIGLNGNIEFDEYQMASYFQALNAVRFESLDNVQREHALLSASLLAERLEL